MQGVFHMVLWEHIECGRRFPEKVGYTLENTMGKENRMGVRQFCRKWEDTRGHYGIELLDKCL